MATRPAGFNGHATVTHAYLRDVRAEDKQQSEARMRFIAESFAQVRKEMDAKAAELASNMLDRLTEQTNLYGSVVDAVTTALANNAKKSQDEVEALALAVEYVALHPIRIRFLSWWKRQPVLTLALYEANAKRK